MNDYLKNRYGLNETLCMVNVQHELLFSDSQLILFKKYLKEIGYIRLERAFPFETFVEIVEVGLEF